MYLSVFGIMLCACCSSASSLEIRTGFFFQVGYPVGSPTNSALKQTSFDIPPLSLRNRTKRRGYTELIGVTEAQHQSKSARLNCTNLTHFRLIAGRFRGNSCIVMLWVACGLIQFAATQ